MKLVVGFDNYKPLRESQRESNEERRRLIEEGYQRSRIANKAMINSKDPGRWRRVSDGMSYGNRNVILTLIEPEILRENCYEISRYLGHSFHVLNPVNSSLFYRVTVEYGGRNLMFICVKTDVYKVLRDEDVEPGLIPRKHLKTFRFYVDKTLIEKLKGDRVLSNLHDDELFDVYCNAIEIVKHGGYIIRQLDFNDTFEYTEYRVNLQG